MKGYNKKLTDVYVLPLPYLVKELPPLIPHNPLSVVLYLWALVVRPGPRQVVHRGVLVPAGPGDPGHSVAVTDPDSSMQLWQQGFFGKGTLSRSEPSWFGRTARRMGLDGGELTLEELTEMRRTKRRLFKRERELAQQQELVARIRAERKPVPADLLAAVEAGQRELASADVSADRAQLRPEDRALIIGDTIARVEYLQLSPCEAVFLSLGLGVLEISNADADDQPNGLAVSDLLTQLLPTPQLWRQYLVYHHLRSLQWCVRSGVKFGVDWLLYRKGPPFQHAEFAIMVQDGEAQPSWAWLHSNMRVVSSAKKTLMLMYVEGPAKMPDWHQVTTVQRFRQALQQYTVKPITFSRFAPSRNRD